MLSKVANSFFSGFDSNEGVYMNIKNCTMVSFYGKKSDLSFVNRIRDIDVSKLETLQKSKIEVLLRLRETKKVIEGYKQTMQEMVDHNMSRFATTAKVDLAEMEAYLEVLKSKLHKINLEILEEEEKNY